MVGTKIVSYSHVAVVIANPFPEVIAMTSSAYKHHGTPESKTGEEGCYAAKVDVRMTRKDARALYSRGHPSGCAVPSLYSAQSCLAGFSILGNSRG